MALTVTTVFAGVDSRILDVTDDGGGLQTAVIAHGLGAIPGEVYLIPRSPECYLSQWSVGAVTATTITLTPTSVGSTGAAGPQVRLIVKRPHSIGR